MSPAKGRHHHGDASVFGSSDGSAVMKPGNGPVVHVFVFFQGVNWVNNIDLLTRDVENRENTYFSASDPHRDTHTHTILT